MNTLLDSILDTIGNTPIVRLNKLGPDNVNTTYLRDQYASYLRALGRDDEADALSGS